MTSLSICIPSYNRPKSLMRTIESIQISESIDFEIVVVDDCSPLQDNISSNIANLSNPRLKYYPLETNVGYDLNLLNCVKYSSKEYVLFLSDDDTIDSNFFSQFFENLKAYMPFIATTAYREVGANLAVRHYGEVKFISSQTSRELAPLLYNFILFSGIVVRRESFLSLLPLDVDGLIYSQLVWSSLITLQHGYHSFPHPLIIPHGDGNIGFGSNSSQDSDVLLSNRNMLLSPISYHRKLFASIRYLSSFYSLHRLTTYFSIEYTVRSYYLLKRSFMLGGRKGLCIFFINIAREDRITLFLPLTFIYFLLLYAFGLKVESVFAFLFGASPSIIYRRIKGGD